MGMQAGTQGEGNRETAAWLGFGHCTRCPLPDVLTRHSSTHGLIFFPRVPCVPEPLSFHRSLFVCSLLSRTHGCFQPWVHLWNQLPILRLLSLFIHLRCFKILDVTLPF